MKTFRARKGPFVEQPYYSNQEIEQTCLEELRSVELLPTAPEPVRIDRFIEKRFKVSPDYQDLPERVLGYTSFGKDGVTGVVVARSLDVGSLVDERRLRTTLAHEAGHCLFHAHLFCLTGQSALFPEGQTASPRVLCRDEARGNGKYTGDWWEFQANRAIGYLLLPTQLTMTALQSLIAPTGRLGLRSLSEGCRPKAVRVLADIFNVNPIVAEIRLKELFPEGNDQQLL